MPSFRKTYKLLRHIEGKYHELWTLLAGMRWYEPNSSIGKDLLSFQPTLAECLYRLSTSHDQMRTAGRDLVQRKSKISSSWFHRRMSALKRYETAIVYFQQVGRLLGDAFVWFFYHGERALLRKHAEHDVSRFPTGTGGLGELGFIQRAQQIGPYFVLLHSNTNMLRVGDFSVVDLENRRILSIGELKTITREGNSVTCRAAFWQDPDGHLESVFEGIPRPQGQPPKTEGGAPPTAEMLARIERQMATIHATMTTPSPEASAAATVASDGYGDAVERALCAHARGPSAVQMVSKSMLVVSVRRPKGSLVVDALTETLPGSANDFPEAAALVSKIAIDGSPHNHIAYGSIATGWKGDPHLPAFAAPILWTFGDSGLVRRLMFREQVAILVFNVAHLVEAIERVGISLRSRSGALVEATVSTPDGPQKVRLGDLDHLVPLVTTSLLSESAVADMFRASVDDAMRIGGGQAQVDVYYDLWHPPALPLAGRTSPA